MLHLVLISVYACLLRLHDCPSVPVLDILEVATQKLVPPITSPDALPVKSPLSSAKAKDSVGPGRGLDSGGGTATYCYHCSFEQLSFTSQIGSGNKTSACFQSMIGGMLSRRTVFGQQLPSPLYIVTFISLLQFSTKLNTLRSTCEVVDYSTFERPALPAWGSCLLRRPFVLIKFNDFSTYEPWCLVFDFRKIGQTSAGDAGTGKLPDVCDLCRSVGLVLLIQCQLGMHCYPTVVHLHSVLPFRLNSEQECYSWVNKHRCLMLSSGQKAMK